MSEPLTNRNELRPTLLQTPTAELVAAVTASRSAEIGQAITAGANNRLAAAALANPALFCRLLSEEQFIELLPSPIPTSFVGIVKLAEAEFGAKADPRLYPGESEAEQIYRVEMWQPLCHLQQMLHHRPSRYNRGQAFYLGGLVAQAGEMFAAGFEYAAQQQWDNITGQTDHFARNAAALL